MGSFQSLFAFDTNELCYGIRFDMNELEAVDIVCEVLDSLKIPAVCLTLKKKIKKIHSPSKIGDVDSLKIVTN